MTFLTVSSNKKIRRELTQLLFSVFPGSVVYECGSDEEAFECASTHLLDKVFIYGAQEFDLLIRLRKCFDRLPIYIMGDNWDQEEEAIWNDATGYICGPVTTDKLRAAMEEQ